jgi:hypothetical protein
MSGHYTTNPPQAPAAADVQADTIEAVGAVDEPVADKPGRPGRKSKTVE